MFYVRLILIFLWIPIFSIFGTIGCLIFWRHPDRVYWLSHSWSWVTRRIMNIQINARGLIHLEQKPAVFVMNHQSFLDMTTGGFVFPRATVSIGKKQIWFIPFFGIVFGVSGNIIIDRQNRKNSLTGLAKGVQAIRERGISMWIFPEGTRNPALNGLLPFKKGAFHVAIEAGVPIIPVVCSSLKPAICFKERWTKPATVEVAILPPISTQGLLPRDAEKLCEETRNKMLEAYRGLVTRVSRAEIPK